jgi:membrane protein DedA with SNARE-associated domain
VATEDLGGIAGWVVDVVDSIGEVGVGALVALETVFPPIPSEIILPFAGFSASQGDINVVVAWVAATLGALVGAWVLYGVGAAIGEERLEALAAARWFPLFTRSDLERGERFFERYGDRVVLLGRCIPLVRSIVSVPAGVERMPLARFTVLTAVGSGVWNAAFIWAGYELGGRWERVERWVKPVGYAVVALLVLGLLWVSVRKVRAVRAGRPAGD